MGRVVLRQKTSLSRKPDTWRYEWDAEDRVTSVATPDGTRWLLLRPAGSAYGKVPPYLVHPYALPPCPPGEKSNP
ncbi:RHS repeat domain-containing protein [Streptomyces sp. RLB1-33]